MVKVAVGLLAVAVRPFANVVFSLYSGGCKVYERLTNKNEIPTIEEFSAYIGKAKELFEIIDDFLINKINSEKMIKFDAHSRCWKMTYHIKKEYVCDIVAENDAFTVVTRLSDKSVNEIINDVSPYAKECIGNSPYRHRGWIEYRVLHSEHIENAKMMFRVRTSRKQKSNA